MKTVIAIAAIATLASGAAFADSRVNALCGVGHMNEAVTSDDVIANPDGFYISSLETQISHGDPRLIHTTGTAFHLCTASAATPDMDTTMALSLMNERRVKFLFVPIDCPKQTPSS